MIVSDFYWHILSEPQIGFPLVTSLNIRGRTHAQHGGKNQEIHITGTMTNPMKEIFRL